MPGPDKKDEENDKITNDFLRGFDILVDPGMPLGVAQLMLQGLEDNEKKNIHAATILALNSQIETLEGKLNKIYDYSPGYNKTEVIHSFFSEEVEELERQLKEIEEKIAHVEQKDCGVGPEESLSDKIAKIKLALKRCKRLLPIELPLFSKSELEADINFFYDDILTKIPTNELILSLMKNEGVAELKGLLDEIKALTSSKEPNKKEIIRKILLDLRFQNILLFNPVYTFPLSTLHSPHYQEKYDLIFKLLFHLAPEAIPQQFKRLFLCEEKSIEFERCFLDFPIDRFFIFGTKITTEEFSLFFNRCLKYYTRDTRTKIIKGLNEILKHKEFIDFLNSGVINLEDLFKSLQTREEQQLASTLLEHGVRVPKNIVEFLKNTRTENYFYENKYIWFKVLEITLRQFPKGQDEAIRSLITDEEIVHYVASNKEYDILKDLLDRGATGSILVRSIYEGIPNRLNLEFFQRIINSFPIDFNEVYGVENFLRTMAEHPAFLKSFLESPVSEKVKNLIKGWKIIRDSGPSFNVIQAILYYLNNPQHENLYRNLLQLLIPVLRFENDFTLLDYAFEYDNITLLKYIEEHPIDPKKATEQKEDKHLNRFLEQIIHNPGYKCAVYFRDKNPELFKQAIKRADKNQPLIRQIIDGVRDSSKWRKTVILLLENGAKIDPVDILQSNLVLYPSNFAYVIQCLEKLNQFDILQIALLKELRNCFYNTRPPADPINASKLIDQMTFDCKELVYILNNFQVDNDDLEPWRLMREFLYSNAKIAKLIKEKGSEIIAQLIAKDNDRGLAFILSHFLPQQLPVAKGEKCKTLLSKYKKSFDNYTKKDSKDQNSSNLELKYARYIDECAGRDQPLELYRIDQANHLIQRMEQSTLHSMNKKTKVARRIIIDAYSVESKYIPDPKKLLMQCRQQAAEQIADNLMSDKPDRSFTTRLMYARHNIFEKESRKLESKEEFLNRHKASEVSEESSRLNISNQLWGLVTQVNKCLIQASIIVTNGGMRIPHSGCDMPISNIVQTFDNLTKALKKPINLDQENKASQLKFFESKVEVFSIDEKVASSHRRQFIDFMETLDKIDHNFLLKSLARTPKLKEVIPSIQCYAQLLKVDIEDKIKCAQILYDIHSKLRITPMTVEEGLFGTSYRKKEVPNEAYILLSKLVVEAESCKSSDELFKVLNKEEYKSIHDIKTLKEDTSKLLRISIM